MIENNEDIKDIFRHLQDCMNFDSLYENHKDYTIECSCGKKWSVRDFHDSDLIKFIQYANMFPHAIRDTAKKNNIPIEEIIIPLLGICVDEVEFEENKLEEPDVELF